MKMTTKKEGKSKEVSISQSAIDENPLAKPNLSLKEAKRENNERKKKELDQKKSEWNS